MSLSTIYPIVIEQGSSWTLPIQWRDSTGALVNLSGYSARMTLRQVQNSTSTAALGPLTPGSGITLGGTPDNIIVAITATQSIGMTILSGFYDLFMDPGGVEDQNSIRLMNGPFLVIPRITA